MVAACAGKPTTFAKAQNAYAVLEEADRAAPAGPYLIGPSDILRISVFGEPELSFDAIPVDSSGSIAFPLIGSLQVANLSTQTVAETLRTQLGSRYIVNPQVTILVTSSAAQRITVEGDVSDPGVFPLVGDNSLLDAMALAKGPTETARLDEIIIFRKVRERLFAAQFDLRAIRRGEAANPALCPGDRIVVGRSAAKGLYRDALQTVPVLTSVFLRVI